MAKACDTSTVLNYAKAKSLYDAGYRYVGRYLSGTVGGKRSKAMTAEEIADIFKAGLRIFAIFQEGTPSMSRYTLESGVSEAQKRYQQHVSSGFQKMQSFILRLIMM